MRRFVWILLALALAAPAPALAEEALRPGGEAMVKAVVDGDTVVLESAVMGARQIRLVGIQAPKLPLGRKNFPTWPLAEESKKALQNLTLGKTVRLSFGGSDKDRYGRLLAHLHRLDGTWVQGEMLKKGMARVYSFADNRAVVGPMLALESEARAARRGIWGLRFYAVRTPQELSSWIGTFQLVEGKVLKAARIKGRVRRTPLIEAAALREPANPGCTLDLKLECLQVTGSFKARGVMNRLATLSDDEISRGMVTASGGNHGLGVAYAGWLTGTPATVYLGHNTPTVKAERLKAWGAVVRMAGAGWDEANEAALAHAERSPQAPSRAAG